MATERIECPSGLILEVRNMKAREMALLADDGEEGEEDGGKRRVAKKVVKRKNPITGVLAGCTLEVVDVGPYEAYGAVAGTIARVENGVPIPGPGKLPWPELLLADRFFALTRIRACTWGDGFEFRVRCKDKTCEKHKKPFLWEIPLSELAIKELPESSRAMVREKNVVFEFELGGRKAKFKLQQGLDEGKGPDMGDIPKREIFLAQCASRLIYVEGLDVSNFAKLLEWVGDLDLPEVLAATSYYDEVDGGIETNTLAECPSCGLEFDVSVPFDGQSFLLPDKKTAALRQMAEPTA